MSHMVQCSVIIYNALANIPTHVCAFPLLPSSGSPLLLYSCRLVASLAVVARSGDHNPLVDVVLASGLVTALGLHLCVSVGQESCSMVGHLTGVPQGLTGWRLPFDLPLPPP